MSFFSRTSKPVPPPTVYFITPQEAQAQAKPPDQTRQPAPDGPQNRYQINQRCIYERRLPGEAYITAHVERLQPGIYEDGLRMSNAGIQKTKAEKPAGEKTVDGKAVSAAARPAQVYGRARDLSRNQNGSRSLRKKANRDSSMHSEYVVGGQLRPMSYHAPSAKDEDYEWPPSPSSSTDSMLGRPPLNVYFLAIGFVLHPSDSLSHRFKSAIIRLNLDFADWTDPGTTRPKIIKYAPHLIYGAVSQETLNWTFNLAGSLGISQGPANASVTPSSQFSESAVLSKMMKIQGSTRTTKTGVEDGELVWSLEENPLQKSGLPREFTFVMLVQCPKGEVDNIDFQIDVEPVINAWYGRYPSFWQKRRRFLPLYKAPLNLREKIGQRFFSSTSGNGPATPVDPSKQYNFANMDGDMDDLVQLPGTTYSLKDDFVNR